MRSLLAIIIATALAIGIFTACREKKDNSQEILAQSMYEKTAEVLKRNTDSLRVARDSASVDSIYEACRIHLENLNFSYPADTDLLLSEGQNDTLALLTSKIAKARHARLYHFAHPDPEPADSCKHDIVL